MEKGLKGSFLGFTFNKIHSSSLGITRTSDNLYSDTLVPTITNMVSTIPKERKVYTGADYKEREIVIPFAFNNLNQQQYNLLKDNLNNHKIADLIFDESPYKVYSAQITNSNLFNFIPAGSNTLLYNGEGKIYFKCYFPYARSRYEFQEDYTVENLPEWQPDGYIEGDENQDTTYEDGYAILQYDLNEDVNSYINSELETYEQWLDDLSLLVDVEDSYDAVTNSYFINYVNQSMYINYEEWIDASQIPSKEDYFLNGQYNITNAGDIPMPIQIIMRAPVGGDYYHSFDILLDGNKALSISNLRNKKDDYCYIIDTGKRAIMGCDNHMQYTGTIYNEYISYGGFFQIDTGLHTVKLTRDPVNIEYNYLYL